MVPALGGGCNRAALLLCFRLVSAVLNNVCFVNSRSAFVYSCCSLTIAATSTNSFAFTTVIMDAHALLSVIVLQYNQCVVYSERCALRCTGTERIIPTTRHLVCIIYFSKRHFSSVRSCTEKLNVVVNMLRSSNHSFRIHINVFCRSVTLLT